MTIDQLSQKTILVTLMRDDMERYSLDFGADEEGARRGLTRLLYRVGEACGLDHSGKSYLIEALPAGDSCLLIISVRPKRRRYRVKRTRTTTCYFFDGIDALLDWRAAGVHIAGGVYALKGGYWLTPDYPPAPRVQLLLSEYAAPSALDAVGVARLRELGTPVAGVGTRRHQRPRPGR